MAIASGSIAVLGPLAAAAFAATPDLPPPTDVPPVGISPVVGILNTTLEAAPLVALVLAVLFRARLRTADGLSVPVVVGYTLLKSALSAGA
jgi:hypothetical protein